MSHRFNPAHADRLLSPERAKSISPQQIIDHLEIKKGQVVADVGAGPGFFAIPIAKWTEQTVYGVDVEPQMLSILSARAKEEEVTIDTLEANAEEIPLPDAHVDRVLCAFVMHEVDHPENALRDFMRITKKDGLIGIVEWEKKVTQYGPPVEERLSKESLAKAVEEANLDVIKWIDLNENHYLCVCKAK